MQTPPNADLLASRMNLAAAIMTLAATLIGIAYAFISRQSKKDRPKAVTVLFQIGTNGLLIAGGLTYWIFRAEELGLAFYLTASLLISIDYVRGTVPAGRGETLMLVLSSVSTGFLLIMHQLTRMLNLIEKLTSVIERIVR